MENSPTGAVVDERRRPGSRTVKAAPPATTCNVVRLEPTPTRRRDLEVIGLPADPYRAGRAAGSPP